MEKASINNMKKQALLLTLFSSLSLGMLNLNSISEVSAKEELSVKSSGDEFNLLDKKFESNESFVYTADLHFKSGQAGGLAFGSKTNEHYYVLNMDRYENKVKLLYFSSNGSGGFIPSELKSDYFIGNDKITQNELDMVNPLVRTIEDVNLKVIVTIEEEHAYAEFYVEGIKRFGIDSVIDLNNLGTSYIYEGGYLGMNCFNADVYLENIEIGKSDYSYFSEPYRNQYHLQPFSKWSNDPNGLCYYNGYYHVFYQVHPFSLQWGPMFWGHARSRDLIHFEFLPLCLFPEKGSTEFGPGDGYMWSGCAISYTKGMSIDIDNRNWFPSGKGNGILAIYTRDGQMQDQVVMSSDDEGLTWTKRVRIPQTLTGYNSRIDWRDPKVFPLVKDSHNKVTTWGMTLSSYGLNKGWFLSSNNLLDWNIAGSFALPTPECIGVGFLTDNENKTHAYLTNKSRDYILGSMSFDSSSKQITFKDESGVDISTYTLENMPLKKLDFGPDSYASQSFYINDPASEFNGKDIVLNWFSGDLNSGVCTGPGEYASLRNRWNGGFTIPVEYGIYKDSDGYRISQKPITVNNSNLEKTEVVNIVNQAISSESDNPLKDVHTHIFELEASLTINDDSPITFKVDIGDDEYMQFGWNKTDGYYVDRTYLNDKGVNVNSDWHAKYASNILGDSPTKTFYVLSDNGGLEVFCENYSISFYFVTTASVYSTGASLKADDALINKLELNEIKSAYSKNTSIDEGVLYVSSNEVSLDDKLCSSKFVTCYYTGKADLVWETISNEEVVEASFTNQGVNLIAKKEGKAQFKISAGNQEQLIDVCVYSSSFVSDLSFSKENIISGQWISKGETILGEKSSGNGFILSNETGSDFTYSGSFSILEGVAASLVFRASLDMSNYLVANYDSNEKIVKLWSTHGELARSNRIEVDVNNIVLSIKANGKNIEISINGIKSITCELKDNEPLSGHFGLNVFSAKAEYKSLSIAKENYSYSSGELEVKLPVDQFVISVYNVTLGNIKLNEAYYYQNNGYLYIKESYFDLLNDNGKYQFKINGASFSFFINVDVETTKKELSIDDMDVDAGNNVNVYIGNTVINSLSVNGVNVDNNKYNVSSYYLHMDASLFNEGENVVTINDSVSFKVNVKNNDTEVIHEITRKDYIPVIIGSSIGGVLVIGLAIALPLIIIKIRRKKDEISNN